MPRRDADIHHGDGASCDRTPRRRRQLVLGLSADITTLQPILSIDANSDNVLALIYAPLLTLDPATGALAPGLAERLARALTESGSRTRCGPASCGAMVRR